MNVMLMSGLAPYSPPLMLDDLAEKRPDLGYATIHFGSSIAAQGPVLRRHWDGRVTIDAGGRLVTGRPAGAESTGGWWRGLQGRA